MKISQVPYLLSITILIGCSTNNGGFKAVPDFEGEYYIEKTNYYYSTRKDGPDFMLTTKSNRPIFEALDTNDDKILDLIRYDVFDIAGNYKYTISDYDMDGRYDERTNTGDPNFDIKHAYIEINYFGCWYKLVKGEKGAVIKVGDYTIPVSLIKGKYIYNKLFKPQGGIPPCSDAA